MKTTDIIQESISNVMGVIDYQTFEKSKDEYTED